MWRSDGLPTSHPISSLVLYNHTVRNQLHKLESACLNTKDINPYSTVPDLKQLWYNDDDHRKLQRKLTIRHDITGSITVRERNINQNNWMEYLM